jgi:hypothetical protein
MPVARAVHGLKKDVRVRQDHRLRRDRPKSSSSSRSAARAFCCRTEPLAISVPAPPVGAGQGGGSRQLPRLAGATAESYV